MVLQLDCLKCRKLTAQPSPEQEAHEHLRTVEKELAETRATLGKLRVRVLTGAVDPRAARREKLNLESDLETASRAFQEALRNWAQTKSE